MANQYHDELGRFCSKNEMGKAVERLADLMSSAPTFKERDEAAAQWIALKSEYDALVKPDYDRQIAELDARIFSTRSRTELRKLEAERAELQLKSDASDEGFNELLRKSLATPYSAPSRFADDWRIERAAVYRTQSDTAEAIDAYKAGTAPRYESTIELFKGTNTKVLRTNERVYIAEQGSSGYEIQHNVALDDPDFDVQILSLRQQVGDRLADQAKYGLSKFDLDLHRTQLYITEPVNALTRQVQYVNDKVSGEIIAKVEFNENGAFQRATIANAANDGSVLPIESPAQLRSYLADNRGYHKLPDWAADKEPVASTPAYAAPASKDIEELDVLF